MKRYAKVLIVILPLLLCLLAGCAYYQKQALPEKYYTAAEMEKQGLERGDYFKKTRYGFRLFTIPAKCPRATR
jgi:hypothetical protein